MSERVLVTGGAGFIGCHVARALLHRGYEVRVLDSLIEQVHGRGAPRDPVLDEVELIRADVRDLDRVTDALDGVDRVIHLAAEVGVGQSMYAIDRYVSVNDTGTAVLFQALIDRPVARVVVASSMSIYGEGLYRTASGLPLEDVVRPAQRSPGGGWDPVGPDGVPLIPLPTPKATPERVGPAGTSSVPERGKGQAPSSWYASCILPWDVPHGTRPKET